MWRDQITSKREKFANEIRRKQHEQIFESRRMEYKHNLEGIMYLPILLDNNAYDDILLILDSIQASPGGEGIDPKLSRVIVQRYQHHQQLHVRMTMLKLMNRLGMWEGQHVTQALQHLAHGDESMLKQISYYLCILVEKQQLQTQNGKQNNNKQGNATQMESIFNAVVSSKLTNMEYRVFWLDIICNAIQASPACLSKCQQRPQLLLLLLEMSLEQDNNSIQLPRAINIMSKVVSNPQFQHALANFASFPKFINYIKNCDIEMVSTGLEIISELLSGDETIIFKLVAQYNVIALLQRYMDHIFVPLQLKAIWGISNVAASEQYHAIMDKDDLLAKIVRKTCAETQILIKSQAYICMINLICNCNSKELQTLASKYKIIQLQCTILEEISSEPAIKDKLLNIALYAVYHTLTDYQSSVVQLEQLGAKKVLAKLYESQKNEEKLKNINIVLDIFQKHDSEPKTSTT